METIFNMRYQIISNSANIFYKLASDLKARVLIPNKTNCRTIANSITGIISEINKTDTNQTYLSYINEIKFLLETLNPAEYLTDEHLENKCISLFSYIFDAIWFTIHDILVIFTTMKLLSGDQINNVLKIDQNEPKDSGLTEYNVITNFFRKNFFVTEMIPWSEEVIHNAKKLIVPLTEIKNCVPNLSEEEEDIIGDWNYIKHRIDTIFSILEILVSLLKRDSSILSNIYSSINDNINKIIAMYEPLQEEVDKILEDLATSELADLLLKEDPGPDDISEEEYKKRLEEVKRRIQDGTWF